MPAAGASSPSCSPRCHRARVRAARQAPLFLGTKRDLLRAYPQLAGRGPGGTGAPGLRVPVWFLLGREDYVTPSEIAVRLPRRWQPPRKTLLWFEHSGHTPPFEEPGRFNAVLDPAGARPGRGASPSPAPLRSARYPCLACAAHLVHQPVRVPRRLRLAVARAHPQHQVHRRGQVHQVPRRHVHGLHPRRVRTAMPTTSPRWVISAMEPRSSPSGPCCPPAATWRSRWRARRTAARRGTPARSAGGAPCPARRR